MSWTFFVSMYKQNIYLKEIVIFLNNSYQNYSDTLEIFGINSCTLPNCTLNKKLVKVSRT